MSDNTDSRVTVLETEFKGLVKTVDKLENKIDDNYATLHHRVSELRDDLHDAINSTNSKIIEKMDLQAKNSSEQHKTIAEKINVLEKWRWMIMGAAIVLGYVLAHVKVDKFF